jgi:hypothetical protein
MWSSHSGGYERSTFFCDTTPLSPLKVNRRLWSTFRLHLQVRRISQESRVLLPTCFTLVSCWFFLGPEDGGDISLRSVGSLSMDYTELWGTRSRSELRHYATSLEVAGSIPDVIAFLNWLNLSSSPLWADWLENVGVSTSHNAMGFHGLLQR